MGYNIINRNKMNLLYLYFALIIGFVQSCNVTLSVCPISNDRCRSSNCVKYSFNTTGMCVDIPAKFGAPASATRTQFNCTTEFLQYVTFPNSNCNGTATSTYDAFKWDYCLYPDQDMPYI